ncbi:hypothetical protein ACU686_31105 [Yinghuangia aomiensis]
MKLDLHDLGASTSSCDDAPQRIRPEHPQVRAVVVGSAKDKVFCAGANIRMPAQMRTLEGELLASSPTRPATASRTPSAHSASRSSPQ